ncbi:BTAD domain-containing putative transcriptional regulator [Acrocarpospora macrocephala]|uniref:SARP family transcriptional regulator n=1 Tax=Acrocarpospora macrocephala TaxID=150177 RepID=A0A5M3WDN3_9ACTN|nr:SARP family transcriptional regulator [Acrocarpospora macrocephala]
MGAQALHFRILTRLEVIPDEGGPLAISPIKRRALCALLLAGEQGLSPGELMEAVWGDGYARDGSLKTCLSQLRRVLPGRIPAGGSGGYRIEFDPADTLDAHRFRALVADSADAVRRGEHDEAVRTLQEALNLWGQGEPPLADLPDHTARLRLLRDELVFERRAAQISLFRERIHLGEHRDVLGDLRRGIAEDPFSEQLHALLMTALYRSGYRAEALRHFDTVSALLLREAGSGPGQALRQLRDAIDVDDEALVLDTRAPAPAAAAPAQAPPPPPLAQLPPDVIDFTGREDEVARVAEFLTPGPDVTGVPIASLIGPPGVGKSALAIHIAHRLRAAFPDGQIYIHLAGMSAHPREAAEVLGELLAFMGAPADSLPASTGERAALFRSMLAGRRVLVVIDDAAGAEHVQPFLPGTAGCAVIVTSRAYLTGGAGIRPFRLEPLRRQEALRLLEEIIGADRVAAEPAAADEVMAACGGFPLAVRIAGARLSAQPNWPIAYFAGRLSDRLRALRANEMTVSASIADSYDALPGPAKQAFRVLALAGPGDFPVWLIAMLLGTLEAEELLETLSDRSLLVTVSAGTVGQPRYRQHDLLRDYAEAQLQDHISERDLAVERLLLGWLELVDRADARLPGEPHFPRPARLNVELFAPDEARHLIDSGPGVWFIAECANILAAIRLACEERRYRLAYGLALRLSSFLCHQSRHREAEDMWDRVMTAALAEEDTRLAAEARLRLAAVVARQPGDEPRAVQLLAACLDAFEQVKNAEGVARSLAWRALVGHRQHTLDAAAADAERGLKLAREVEDAPSEVACLRVLGLVAAAEGRPDEAIQLCESAHTRAEKLARESGERVYECLALDTLITVKIAAGHHDQALELCDHGRVLGQETGDIPAEAAFEEFAGDALAGLDRPAEAITRYTRAAGLFEIAADDRRPSLCRVRIAAMYAAQGSLDEARKLAEQAAADLENLGFQVEAQEARRAARGW